MVDKLLSFVKKQTSLNIAINTAGNYLNVAFTAASALILVRVMGPVEYGVLSVLLGIVYVLANVLDFGVTATIYSYLPPLLTKKRSDVYRFVKTVFFYQSALSSASLIILVAAFPYLDRIFFKTGAHRIDFYLTGISTLLLLWQNFNLNIHFAARKFVPANIYLNISNVVKMIALAGLIWGRLVTIGSIIAVFGIVGPLAFFACVVWEKKDAVTSVLAARVRRSDFRPRYTITYFIATQFYNMALRMDLFLLSFFGLRAEVGYYGLAQKIILTIVSTIISVTQVLSPHFAHVKNKKQALHEFKTGLLYFLIPAALFVILFFVPDWLFFLFFTPAFAPAASITHILALPFILFTLAHLPMLFLLYTVRKPIYILAGNIVYFVGVTAGSYLLIPHYGVYGPPYAIVASLLATIAIFGVGSQIEYKKLPK